MPWLLCSPNPLHLDMNFSEVFPVLKEYTYLNTANSGILSNALTSWRASHDAEFILAGSTFRLQQLTLINELRNNLSGFFGAKPENTFLIPNFSLGYNTVLNGMAGNHRFLLLHEDYPSVNYPVASRGFEHLKIPITENPEDSILKGIEYFRPTVVAFSMVQYINGIRIDPNFLRQIKKTYPDLLLICDGTQFCGTAIFDFQNSGLDALISSGYKWMLGGYGNGFLFLSNQLKEGLYQDRKNVSLPAESFLKGKDYLSLCFEPGHLDTLNFGTLNQSILYLKSIGIEKIEQMSQSISQKAREAFYSRGLLPERLVNRKTQSTIMSLELEPALVKEIQGAKILCSARGSGTRFSFHFYNTEDDLARVLDVFDKNR